MKKIGFVISGKENEKRRAILPADLARVRNRAALVFEQNYGAHFGISDDEYRKAGCHVAPKQQVYECEIICNPKAPEPAERLLFSRGQTLFGWVHAVQGRTIVDFLLDHQMSAVAWEDMFEHGRHVFYRNNEIAGEAAIFHAINYLGRLPYGLRAALIGTGNCARGALRVLSQLGFSVTVFDRKTVFRLPHHVEDFDVIVNAVLWDVFRNDHILTANDVARMRPGSMIIDISCDEKMGIETSRPTPIYDPVYEEAGVTHYVVDHTPALYWRSATEAISAAVAPYLDQLVEGKPGECLEKATVVQAAKILDDRILRFQQREPVAAR